MVEAESSDFPVQPWDSPVKGLLGPDADAVEGNGKGSEASSPRISAASGSGLGLEIVLRSGQNLALASGLGSG